MYQRGPHSLSRKHRYTFGVIFVFLPSKRKSVYPATRRSTVGSTTARICRAPARRSCKSRRKARTLLFFQGRRGLGLTTALGVLRSGLVLVGNVPSTGGAG